MLMYIPFGISTGRLGGEVTAIEELGSSNTPDRHSLSNAYPNPFNSEVAIEFAVYTEDNVKIEVFNPVGQVVARLVDEVLSAGSYRINWHARDKPGSIASGIYFIRMTAGEFSETRSATLLK